MGTTVAFMFLFFFLEDPDIFYLFFFLSILLDYPIA